MIAAVPAMRNRPQKLLKLSLEEVILEMEDHELSSFLNHFLCNWFIFSLSVTFNTALDMSATNGEPMGNAYRHNYHYRHYNNHPK